MGRKKLPIFYCYICTALKYICDLLKIPLICKWINRLLIFVFIFWKFWNNSNLLICAMSKDKIHYRNILLHEFRRRGNASDPQRNICSVHGEVISERMFRKWFIRFRSNDFDLNDRPKSGRPSVVDNDVLISMVDTNPQLTSRELANILSFDHKIV